MLCKECYVWRQRVDSIREQQRNLVYDFCMCFGAADDDNIMNLLKAKAEQLRENLEVLMLIRNTSCAGNCVFCDNPFDMPEYRIYSQQ